MVKKLSDFYALYDYYNKIKIDIPYWFNIDFENWCQSMFKDTDCDNQILFQELHTYVSVSNDEITGFIQFGIPAFVFNKKGEKDTTMKAGIIRNLYFAKGNEETGKELLRKACSYFDKNTVEWRFAFYHYFGMTCNASHGKLDNTHFYIENLLASFGYVKEHENVYYKRILTDNDLLNSSDVALQYCQVNNKGLCEFYIVVDDLKVGEGRICYLPQKDISYLKWIYINDDHKSKGYATAALRQLFSDLRKQGIHRIDTDTADGNVIAQGLYTKIGFADMGRTRSYEMREDSLCL